MTNSMKDLCVGQGNCQVEQVCHRYVEAGFLRPSRNDRVAGLPICQGDDGPAGVSVNATEGFSAFLESALLVGTSPRFLRYARGQAFGETGPSKCASREKESGYDSHSPTGSMDQKPPCNITPPALRDNTADGDRLIKGIERALGGGEAKMDLSLSRKIPSLLRGHHYQAEAVLYRENSSWHLVDILPPTEAGSIYGLAVDLGTSMIAVRLLDLATGAIKEETSFLNPQSKSGRTSSREYTTPAKKAGSRNSKLSWWRVSIRKPASSPKNGYLHQRIVGASVGGNTTMTHLFWA